MGRNQVWNAFLTMAGFYGVVFVQSIYFQQSRGHNPLQTRLLFLPMTALVAILNPFAARLANRFGAFVPIINGQLLMIAVLIALGVTAASSPVLVIAALMVPVGVGGSVTKSPEQHPGLSGRHHRSGDQNSGAGQHAVAVLNTFRQLSGSLGVAASGAIIASNASFLTGQHTSPIAITALLIVSVATSILATRKRRAVSSASGYVHTQACCAIGPIHGPELHDQVAYC